MNSKLVTAALILAIGFSGQAAQATGSGQISAGQTQSQVGLLLPAVQAARDPGPEPTSSSQDGTDLLIINNGDGSDFSVRALFGRVQLIRSPQ